MCGVYGGRVGWGVGEVECVCVGGGCYILAKDNLS